MAEPINLNRHRKALAERERERHAAENRVRHGRTKAERERDRLAEERRRALLDGARKDP